MKTYIVTAHMPRNGDTGLVTVLTPLGQIYKREPIQPSYVPEMENDDYAVNLMRKMFPVSGTILGDKVVWDSAFEQSAGQNFGRIRVWAVDCEGDLPAV